MKTSYIFAAFLNLVVCNLCLSQTPQILQATYGAGSNRIDVTGKLQSLVEHPQPDMRVNSQLFGSDAASGEDKTLSIVFAFNGLQYQIELQDGAPLSFANAAPFGGKVEVPELENAGQTPLKASVAVIPPWNSNDASSHVEFIVREYTKGITNLKTFKTDKGVLIQFDFDVNKATEGLPPGFQGRLIDGRLPLLLSLYDDNGKYLTHFITSELFTVDEQRVKERGIFYTNKPPRLFVLLKPNNNILRYGVNRRDLRDTAAVVIQFDNEPGD